MKLAVSNIAWPASARNAAYRLLQAHGIGGLEIAPGLLFEGTADALAPTDAEVTAALAPIRDAGLELVSMQSLLFNVEGAALFGDDVAQARFRAAMQRAIALAGRLAIPNLVFGSPRHRIIPAGLDPAAADAIALATFRDLGDAAAAAGSRLAIEPNPAAYGTNFLTDTAATLAFVERVAHPAVVLNFDLGALHMSGDFDRVEALAAKAGKRIGHAHISEPQLGAAPADPLQAARAVAALSAAGYCGYHSIEMKAPPGGGEAALAQLTGSLDGLLAAVRRVGERGGAA